MALDMTSCMLAVIATQMDSGSQPDDQLQQGCKARKPHSMPRGHPKLQRQPASVSCALMFSACGIGVHVVCSHLINCGLHVPGVCRGHGLQGNWVLTAHLHVSNLQQASQMLLEKLGNAYFSTWEHVAKAYAGW